MVCSSFMTSNKSYFKAKWHICDYGQNVTLEFRRCSGRTGAACGITIERYLGAEAQDNNPGLTENYTLNNLLCGTACKPELMQADTLKQAGVYWSCDAADLSFVRISREDNRTAEVF